MIEYDAVVVGAGPSGSTAAFYLARAGAKVLLVDKAKFPREKPCGGGVTARCLAEAPVDLAPVIEHVVHTVRFSYKLGEFFDYTYRLPLVYMTQRGKMDAYLVDQAVHAGARFRDCSSVSEIEPGASGARLRVDGETVEAPVLVGADGANGIVARAAGLQPVADAPVALEANFPYDRVPDGWSDHLALELGSMPGGYGWSFPKSDHFNVGCGGFHNQGTKLREHLKALRHHYELDNVEGVNLRGHHLPTRTDGLAISRGRVLLVGDAAGLVDPMSGEGIYAAFVSGRLASRTVRDFLDGRTTDLSAYEAAVERTLVPDIRAAEVLRDAYHFTPRIGWLGLKHSELLRRSLCQIITGERSYEGFFNMLGPAGALLRLWAARGIASRHASPPPQKAPAAVR